LQKLFSPSKLTLSFAAFQLLTMKAKHTILLIALGFCLEYMASLSRIFNRSETQTLVMLATLLKITGVLWLAYKVMKYEGFRKFMER
jgi:hypothetical protein